MEINIAGRHHGIAAAPVRAKHNRASSGPARGVAVCSGAAPRDVRVEQASDSEVQAVSAFPSLVTRMCSKGFQIAVHHQFLMRERHRARARREKRRRRVVDGKPLFSVAY